MTSTVGPYHPSLAEEILPELPASIPDPEDEKPSPDEVLPVRPRIPASFPLDPPVDPRASLILTARAAVMQRSTHPSSSAAQCSGTAYTLTTHL